MPNPAAPSDPKTLDIPLTFEDRVKLAWGRYGTAIYAAFVLVALGILVKGGLDYLSARKELAVQRDYAACTAPDMLKAFAESHRGHPLAGVAELRVADSAYGTGKFADAAAGYATAISDLPAGPFLARAKLGLAMAQAESGKPADAEAGLRQVYGDESQLKPIRCEAAYHLASLEVSQGRTGDVQRLTEDVMRIDPSSPFAERMIALRNSVPDTAPSLLSPAVSLPAKP